MFTSRRARVATLVAAGVLGFGGMAAASPSLGGRVVRAHPRADDRPTGGAHRHRGTGADGHRSNRSRPTRSNRSRPTRSNRSRPTRSNRSRRRRSNRSRPRPIEDPGSGDRVRRALLRRGQPRQDGQRRCPRCVRPGWRVPRRGHGQDRRAVLVRQDRSRRGRYRDGNRVRGRVGRVQRSPSPRRNVPAGARGAPSARPRNGNGSQRQRQRQRQRERQREAGRLNPVEIPVRSGRRASRSSMSDAPGIWSGRSSQAGAGRHR
jgi:hypothetical protein